MLLELDLFKWPGQDFQYACEMSDAEQAQWLVIDLDNNVLHFRCMKHRIEPATLYERKLIEVTAIQSDWKFQD